MFRPALPVWSAPPMSTRAQRRRQQRNDPSVSPSRRKNFIGAAIAVVLVAAIVIYAVIHSRTVPGAAVSPADTANIPPMTKVGAKAKPFSVRAPMGVISSVRLAGKPYMLEIFATWCPHCQVMAGGLKKIRAQIPESKLAMISVTGSPYAADATAANLAPESQADVDRFDAGYGVTWPTIFDSDLSVVRTWGMDGFPTIYIVNAKGVVTYAHSGEISQHDLLAAIRKAGVS